MRQVPVAQEDLVDLDANSEDSSWSDLNDEQTDTASEPEVRVLTPTAPPEEGASAPEPEKKASTSEEEVGASAPSEEGASAFPEEKASASASSPPEAQPKFPATVKRIVPPCRSVRFGLKNEPPFGEPYFQDLFTRSTANQPPSECWALVDAINRSRGLLVGHEGWLVLSIPLPWVGEGVN